MRENLGRQFGYCILFAAFALLIAGAGQAWAAAVTIDNFTTSQALVSQGPSTGSTNAGVSGAGMFLGSRNINVTLSTQNGGNQVQSSVAASQASFSRGADAIGNAVFKWDGTTGAALSLTSAPVDLTGGGTENRIRLKVKSNDVAGDATFVVYTDATHCSTQTLNIPNFTANTNFDFMNAAFTTGPCASPATFTQVRAIVLTVGNGSSTIFSEDLVFNLVTTPVELQSFTAD